MYRKNWFQNEKFLVPHQPRQEQVPHEPRQEQVPHEPRITVRAPKSREGIPKIDVIFPDGHEDTMVLQRHYDSKEARMGGALHCNYFGHLKNDREACVAVTGCIGQDDMEFTINSKHAIDTNMYILEKNGNLRAIKSALKVINYAINVSKKYKHICWFYNDKVSFK